MKISFGNICFHQYGGYHELKHDVTGLPVLPTRYDVYKF